MSAQAFNTEALHPSYITDENGKKTSVVLSLEVFQQLMNKVSRVDEERELQKLLETSEDTTDYLLSSPKNAERLTASVAELEAGNGEQHELIEP